MAHRTGDGSGNLERAFDLLHAILCDGGQSGIGAIAARLRLPLSSAHRLVSSLERRGFLARSGRGRYIAGLALASVISRGELDQALVAVGRPVLKWLAMDTGYTAHLGVLRSDMVTYLVKEGVATGRLFTREMMQLEAYCSGIGKILLAQLSEEDLTEYLNQGEFVALTERTIIDPSLLADHLRTVRQQDYALDNREISNDLNCLAVPIRRGDGRVIAAISIAANVDITSDMPALLVKLRAATNDIERQMVRL